MVCLDTVSVERCVLPAHPQAYRKRVLETHPDKAPVKSAANADAFAELQAAYALIRDEEVRKNFDLQMRIGRYTGGATAARYAMWAGELKLQYTHCRLDQPLFCTMPRPWTTLEFCLEGSGALS